MGLDNKYSDLEHLPNPIDPGDRKSAKDWVILLISGL